MNDTFRRWLRPMPTSRQPASEVRFRDKRPVNEQVASGLRIAAWMIGGVLALGLAGRGVIDLHANRTLQGFCELSIPLVAMFVTVHRWAGIVAGLFFLPIAGQPFRRFPLIQSLVTGKSPNSPYESIPRYISFEILVYALIVVALTYRFARKRPAVTSIVDRVALTFFVVVSLNQSAVPYSFPPLSLTLGLLALAIAWLVYRWDRWKHPGKHHREPHASTLPAVEPSLKSSSGPSADS